MESTKIFTKTELASFYIGFVSFIGIIGYSFTGNPKMATISFGVMVLSFILNKLSQRDYHTVTMRDFTEEQLAKRVDTMREFGWYPHGIVKREDKQRMPYSQTLRMKINKTKRCK
jgi:hypothetical protein